jgi:hypothetical protein
MVKIRKATTKSDSLEITLPTGGRKNSIDARPAGFQEGRDADWELVDGKLVLKLRPKAEGAVVEVKSEEHVLVGETKTEGDTNARDNPQG